MKIYVDKKCNVYMRHEDIESTQDPREAIHQPKDLMNSFFSHSLVPMKYQR